MIEISQNLNASKFVFSWIGNPCTWLQRSCLEAVEISLDLLAKLKVGNLVLNFGNFNVSIKKIWNRIIKLGVNKSRLLNNILLTRNELLRIPTLLVNEQN